MPSSDAVLTTIEVVYKNEPRETTETYQLPLAIAAGSNADKMREHSRSVVTAYGTGSEARVLYDASADESFRIALLKMIADGGSTAGSGEDALVGERTSALDASALEAAASKVGSAEQSNTSIIFGEAAILKLFRRLSPGQNPEVEITRFLTETAHFQNIPAYLGDLQRKSDGGTAAVLQAFAANEGDGWTWTLGELGRYYEEIAGSPPPASVGSPAAMGSTTKVSPEAQEYAGLYLDAAQLLGRRTAELHLALATPAGNAAFAPEEYDGEGLAMERERIEQQVNGALATLERTLATSEQEMAPGVSQEARDLLQQRGSLKELLAGLNGDPAQFGQRIRIHGDYHLGQLLRAKNDFLIVDFEGEPARLLEERRRKQSPLRDVAGMLRSFSYAANSALSKHAQRLPEHGSNVRLWAKLWERSISTEFLRGYRETMGMSALLPAGEKADLFLRALLLEKACYELAYELNNRPSWVHIPLAGIRELVE